MAHALGGVLAMLFWGWFRRRYGGGKTAIAVAVMIVFVAAAALAETPLQPLDLSKIPARDRPAITKAYKQLKECEPNPESPKCQKQRNDGRAAMICSQTLSGMGQGVDHWTPRRQKECERAMNGGKKEWDRWENKHAKWWRE